MSTINDALQGYNATPPSTTNRFATQADVAGLGSGTVTSVGQTVPAEFSVAGSPVTTAGTLAITKATQTANTVWAGPTGGGVAQPAFRVLVMADMPAGTGTVTSVGATSPLTSSGGATPTISTSVATGTLAGRTTAGTGVLEAVTVDSSLGLAALVLQRAALTGDVTASAGSNATTIAAGVVTLAKMADLATNKLIGRSTAGTGVPEAIDLTAAGRALIDDADAAAQRTTLGLGTAALAATGDFQPIDADLTALAAAPWAANAMPVGTGASTLAQTAVGANQFLARSSVGNVAVKALTDFALTFLDDADAAAVRTTIGAGTGSGTVTSVGATAPITSSGGATPSISTSMATDRLLGRDTAGAGVAEEISLGASLEWSGTGSIQRAALTGDVAAAANGNATTLATVNANVGNFGTATAVSTVTVNAKGLVTAASNTTIQIAESQVDGLTAALGLKQDALTAVTTGRNINTTAPVTGGGNLSADRTIAISDFVGSGASHARGTVPTPGASAGTTRFLREDATWAAPAGGSGLTQPQVLARQSFGGF